MVQNGLNPAFQSVNTNNLPCSETSTEECNTPIKSRKRRRIDSDEEIKRNAQCRWTKEHDIELYKAVLETGAKKWREVASKIAGGAVYNKDQCYQRWWRVLTIALDKEEWIMQDDDKLLEIISEIGDGNWAKIGGTMNKSAVLCLHRYNQILDDVDCDISAVFHGSKRIRTEEYFSQELPVFGTFLE
jgi:hypothetical protein